MPQITPNWSQLQEFVWPVEGTYEGTILSSDEYAEEVPVDEEKDLWQVRFKILVTKCRDREDGKIVLDTDEQETVDELELTVTLPTSGPFVWRLREFLRVLGYPKRGKVDAFDTNDWHGKRVIFRITKRANEKTGREYHNIEWLARLPDETEQEAEAV